MKRFITVLSGLLVLPAFAEVAPVYYDEIVEYTDEMIDAETDGSAQEENVVQTKGVTQRNTINRTTSASRAISAASGSGASRTNTSSRAMATSPRSATGTSRATTARTTRTSAVRNKASATSSRPSVTSRGIRSTKPVTARVGVTSNSIMPAARNNAAVISVNELTDSGNALYNANPETARVGASIRRTSGRLSTSALSSVSTTPTVTEEEVSSTTNNLTAISELMEYCKAQYAACMDNYCNVLDDNQGRCSCSKNIKNYSKSEAALESATEQFQEAIQKIRYIGLTGQQIEALFAETEAELAMKSNSDSSQIKTSLDAIKRKVVDVSTPSSTSSYEVTSGLSLDLNGLLNADFTAGFDLNSFLGTNKNNTTSVSNQRGEQLYKSATARCKTAILNSCTEQGIDANVITNSYDLEIDKQCIVYERALNEANKEMKNNVFNATNILQQARLLLTQNKNSYDLRGCVAAIDSCMQDEYICGSDYELCLDPTGKYLANGEVVKGSTPGVSGGTTKNQNDKTENDGVLQPWHSNGMYDLYSTWDYPNKNSQDSANAWSRASDENLGGYVDAALESWAKEYTEKKGQTLTENLARFLLQKIGYIDSDDKVHGMCASVMKQCQDYTFTEQKSSKKYIPDNDVVRQYLNTTLAKIKVQQDELLASYAEGCRADVQSCLSSNGYDDSNTTSTVSRTAVNACVAEITTCMSVGGYTPKDGTKLTLRAMNDWVSSILTNCPADYYVEDDGINAVKCKYCPAVSEVTVGSDGAVTEKSGGNPVQTQSAGGQSMTCECPESYSTVYVVDGHVSDLTSDRKPANIRCQKVTEGD